MKIICKFIASVLALSVVVTAFKAYFLRTVDLKNEIIYDGLGRALSEPPIWAKILITEENIWAGIGWHFIDIIWFFGGLYLAYRISILADD